MKIHCTFKNRNILKPKEGNYDATTFNTLLMPPLMYLHESSKTALSGLTVTATALGAELYLVSNHDIE